MNKVKFFVIALFLGLVSKVIDAQDTPPQIDNKESAGDKEAAIRRHVRAIEESYRGATDELLDRFNSMHFSAVYLAKTSADERLMLLDSVRIAASGANNVLLDVINGKYILSLNGDRNYNIVFTVEEREPFGISSMSVTGTSETSDQINITRENAGKVFDLLEAEGIAGVIYIHLDGGVVLERAFGMANRKLGIPNELNTVFGIGSRPIDFTMAAIYLLDQQGRIDQDDMISKYFEDVPADKRSITIGHLMTGQSGLPDFFHTGEDWDPDLAWIDRKTAEQRLLSQELLFTPGEDRIHSHGAFGLLAALIERVTGMTYYGFIRKNFLDPAGMSRTGEYGETRGLSLSDFAVGGGPKFVGLPNIPPNWGPASWLIKGSGGMYSTLGDLQKFYDYLRSGKVLEPSHLLMFLKPAVNIDGSDRGFELFSAYNPSRGMVYLFINEKQDRGKMQQLFRSLAQLTGFGE